MTPWNGPSVDWCKREVRGSRVFFTNSVTRVTSWGDGAEEGLIRAGGVRLAGFFTDSVTRVTSWGDWADEGLVRAGGLWLAGFFTDSVTSLGVE